MRRPVVMSVLVTLVLAACAGPPVVEALASAWIGRPATELRDAMGPPTSEYSDAGGGTVLVYDSSYTLLDLDRVVSSGTRGYASRNEPTATVRQRTIVRRFYVGADGLVWRVE